MTSTRMTSTLDLDSLAGLAWSKLGIDGVGGIGDVLQAPETHVTMSLWGGLPCHALPHTGHGHPILRYVTSPQLSLRLLQ